MTVTVSFSHAVFFVLIFLLQPSLDESKVNEEEFYSAVSESTSKVYLHSVKLSKELLAAGDMQSLLKLVENIRLFPFLVDFFNKKSL